MLKIALVTARAARHRDGDAPLLEAALRGKGVDAHTVAWDDSEVDWSTFDCAVVRSTWDYTTRPSEFAAWIDRVSVATNLLNPPSLLHWNIDKHYLADLAAHGVPTIPTTFVEPGQEAARAVGQFLHQCAAAEFVVKPSVSAGAKDAQRYGRLDADRAAAIEHTQRLLHANRSVLLQPYFDRVGLDGETALIYFAGTFSHAIRKGALLRPRETSTQDLFAATHIIPRAPGVDELDVGARVIAILPNTPLYARVDLIRDTNAIPCVLELELTEPLLFLAHEPESAIRFAETICRWCEPGYPCGIAGQAILEPSFAFLQAIRYVDHGTVAQIAKLKHHIANQR